MIKWILNFSLIKDNRVRAPMYVGARVKTKHGMATVTGGSVNVRLDQPIKHRNGSLNNGITINIEDFTKV